MLVLLDSRRVTRRVAEVGKRADDPVDGESEFVLSATVHGLFERLSRSGMTAECVGPHAGPRLLAQRPSRHEKPSVSIHHMAGDGKVPRGGGPVHAVLALSTDRYPLAVDKNNHLHGEPSFR